VEVPEDKYGVFSSGDCYLVLYVCGSEKFIIYMWQGADASTDERGACAIAAVELDEEICGGTAAQVSQSVAVQAVMQAVVPSRDGANKCCIVMVEG
jgi:hypothetical protein